nr:ATP-grasp domain-containing protein [uncultured Niameybacter sp.]
MSEKIIVTDGQWRKSLSAIRGVGQEGFEVYVLGESIFTTGFWSKYTKKYFKVTEAKSDVKQFGKSIYRILSKQFPCDKIIILPMEVETLLWFVKNQESLRDKIYISAPKEENIMLAENKYRTMMFAKKLGINIPETVLCENYEQLIEALGKFKGKEFVVKPVTSNGARGVIYPEDISRINLKEYFNDYGPVIIQDRIPMQGKGIGVEVLMNKKGKCVAFFSHERLHQYPNTGGSSTKAKSIYRKDIIQQSIKMLEELEWEGVAMVEWKDDPRDGIPKLIEINPRFWGSLELSVRCGVNFPALYARQARGEELEECSIDKPMYELGKACRWLLPGDILRYITADKGKRESLKEFFTGLPGEAEEWNKKDLKGFIAAIICPILLAINPKYWKYIKKK